MFISGTQTNMRCLSKSCKHVIFCQGTNESEPQPMERNVKLSLKDLFFVVISFLMRKIFV